MKQKKSEGNFSELPIFGTLEKLGAAPARKPEQPDLSALQAPANPEMKIENSDNTEKSQEGRAIALRYYEKKKIVYQRDKDNQTMMMFIKAPSKKEWYKGFGKTAIYFLSFYKEKIGSKAKLQVDRDYQLQFNEGFVATPNIIVLADKLKPLGIRMEEEENGIITFHMNRRVKADEYNLLKAELHAPSQRANEIIKPKEVMPKLFEDTKAAFATIYRVFNNMSDFPKQALGIEMARLLLEIGEEYAVLAKDGGDAEAFFDLATENVSKADGIFLMISPLNIIGDKKQLEIAQLLSKLRHQIVEERKRKAVNTISEQYYGNGKIINK